MMLVFACGASFAQKQNTTPADPKMKAVERKAKEATDDLAKYITLTPEQKEKLMIANRNIAMREMELKENPNNEKLKDFLKKDKLREYRTILDGKQFHDYLQHNHMDESVLSDLN